MQLTILLVEDNPADADLLIDLLEDSENTQWQITHVERLKDAIQMLAHRVFDAVFLDLSLPDSHGLDTVRTLQARIPQIPIIVLTGLQDKAIALQAVAEGAQDYLLKGNLSLDLLERTVKYAIERVQILKKLQNSEHLFRGVFDQTFQLMALLDPNGNLLDVNCTARKEVSPFRDEDTLHRPLWQAPFWHNLEPSQNWLREAIPRAAQGEMMRTELQVLTANSQSLWLDCSIKPLHNEDGEIILLIAEGRDISNLKRAEAETYQALQQERELNQLKNSFISMVSHEFRNPMGVIRCATELLREIELPKEKQNQYFNQIEASIHQMLELLDEILLLGRTEAGRMEVTPVLLNLKTFCQELVDTFQLTSGSAYQIVFACQGTIRPVNLDPSLLRHILNNLISNAIKYSPQGGSIYFTLQYGSDHVIFRIQDQGIGIPAQDQTCLFETFHRASNVGRIQGTGLGLAIVKRCVDLYQGKIEVKSTEGTGTTFTVSIPTQPNFSVD